MLNPNFIDPELIYFFAAILIAVCILIECQMIEKNQGKMPDSKGFNFVSLMDTVWFLIALLMIFFGDFGEMVKVVAIVYVVYTVFGWVYNIGLGIKEEGSLPDSAEDLVIYKSYLAYSRSFALVYMLLCVWAIVRHLHFGG